MDAETTQLLQRPWASKHLTDEAPENITLPTLAAAWVGLAKLLLYQLQDILHSVVISLAVEDLKQLTIVVPIIDEM